MTEFRSQRRRYVRDAAANRRDAPRPTPKPLPRPPIRQPEKPGDFVLPGIPRPSPRPSKGPISIRPVPVQRQVYYYYNYFLGNWNGLGYTCDAKTPQIEVVNIILKRKSLCYETSRR